MIEFTRTELQAIHVLLAERAVGLLCAGNIQAGEEYERLRRKVAKEIGSTSTVKGD